MAGPIEFTCSWEAWYAGVVPDREVNLQAPTTDLDGQPVDAYATFVEHKVGAHTAVRLEVWSDGWRILRDHLSLFTRITARLGPGATLEEVVVQLVEYGCTDVTPRATPAPPCQSHSAAGTRHPKKD